MTGGADLKIDLKFLMRDFDRHGNERLYYRRPGMRKVRLRATPGTKEFLEEYARARDGAEPVAPEKKRTEAKPASLRWLAQRYYESADFKSMMPRSRRVRRNLIEAFMARLDADGIERGDKPYAAILPRHVFAWRDKQAETPEAANAVVKALRQIFAYAIAVGIATTNPARDVSYLKGSDDGWHTWTVEEVRQFEARHPIGSKARLALALLLYTGVRRSDVVNLGRQMERDGELRWTEVKGRKKLRKDRRLPLLPELRAVLDATKSDHLTYLVSKRERAFSAASFGNWFRERCDEAGLEHCSAHGLRKAGATIAAENGATEHQLMAIYGWESPKQAARYTKKANRAKMAADAMHLIVPNAPLSQPMAEVGQKRRSK